MNTLFESYTDTYLDIGHDTDSIKRGAVALWAAYESEDDIRIVPGDNPLQGHALAFPSGYDYYGRIDNETRKISFTRAGGGYKEDYFKNILEMEYPGYDIIDL